MTTISKYKCDVCLDEGRYTVLKDINGITGRDGTYQYHQVCSCFYDRHQDTIENLLHNTEFHYEDYANKTLDSFIATDDMTKAMKDIAYYFLWDIEKATGCGFFGNSGTGKTHISIAICQDLTRTYARPHRYFSYRSEVQRLKSIYFKKNYHAEIKALVDAPLLYIDDFLKFANATDGKINTQELQIVYEIINGRYLNKKKTIFSSEYTVSEMRNIDEALASRVYEMVGEYAMKCEGKNRRFEK